MTTALTTGAEAALPKSEQLHALGELQDLRELTPWKVAELDTGAREELAVFRLNTLVAQVHRNTPAQDSASKQPASHSVFRPANDHDGKRSPIAEAQDMLFVYRLREIFDIYWNLVRTDRVTTTSADITYEFLRSRQGRIFAAKAKHQIVAHFACSMGRAQQELTQAVLAHQYCQNLMDEVVLGVTPRGFLETAVQKLKSLEPVPELISGATGEEKQQHADQRTTMMTARQELADQIIHTARRAVEVQHHGVGNVDESSTSDAAPGEGTPNTGNLYDGEYEASSAGEGKPDASSLAGGDPHGGNSGGVSSDRNSRGVAFTQQALRWFKVEAERCTQRTQPASRDELEAREYKKRNLRVSSPKHGMQGLNVYLRSSTVEELSGVLKAKTRSARAHNLFPGETATQIEVDIFEGIVKTGIALMNGAAVPADFPSTPGASSSTTDAVKKTPVQQASLLGHSDFGDDEDVADLAQDAGRVQSVGGVRPEIQDPLEGIRPFINKPAGLPPSAVYMIDVETKLQIGAPVDPQMLPILESIRPEWSELARRNNDFHKKRIASGNFGQDPPWWAETDTQVQIRGSTRTLSLKEAALFEQQTREFTVLFMSPITGQQLGHGRFKRLATPELSHAMRLRDHTCRHPGCKVRAEDCEHDHVIDWLLHDGPTDYWNMLFLCREHHWQKTAGWYHVTLRPDLGDGAVEFHNLLNGEKEISHPEFPLDDAMWKALHLPRMREWAQATGYDLANPKHSQGFVEDDGPPPF